LLSASFVSAVPTLEIPITWEKNEGCFGYHIYYDTQSTIPMDGTGASQGNSPILVTDPNQTSMVITGLPRGTWYFRIGAMNEIGLDGELSSAKRYETLKGFVATEPGVYGAGQEVTFRLDFQTSTYCVGQLYCILNNGKIITIPDDNIHWVTYVNVNYIIGNGEEIAALSVSDIYLDPNDPSAYLHGGGTSYNVCTDIPIGANLDADPNAIIEIVATQPPVTGFTVGCCTD
jgi:hypothetical protein